jgi:hypothetical protein
VIELLACTDPSTFPLAVRYQTPLLAGVLKIKQWLQLSPSEDHRKAA